MSTSGHAAPRVWPSSLLPPALSAEEILWSVHERHLDEACFCFELRDVALDAPHYSVAEVEAGPERRLFNHLEGLRRGGPLVAQHLLEGASNPEHDIEKIAVATLGVLAAYRGQPASIEVLLAQLCAAQSEAQREGMVRALGLGVDPNINASLLTELSQQLEGTSVHAASLRALANHFGAGLNPSWTGRLGALLSSPDAEVVQAAAELAKFDSDPRTLEILASVAQVAQQTELGTQTDHLRRATLESALVHGLPGSGDWTRHWAQQAPSSLRDSALIWLASLGGPSEHEWLIWLAANSEPSRALLWALGYCGRVEAVDQCIAWIGHPELAPLAAEAICAITGLPTQDERYWLSPSDVDLGDALPPLEHDDLDANLSPSSDDALPRPDPDAFRNWWTRTRPQFSTGLRYLAGHPLDGRRLLAAIEHGNTRRRAVLAFELAVRSRGRASINTRAWCWAQRASLAAAAEHIVGVDPQAGKL